MTSDLETQPARMAEFGGGTDQRLLKPRPWLAVRTLCWREVIRFFRQRNRVIGAVGQPVLFWLLFGLGFQQSFRLSGAGEAVPSFREYYFPGTLILILLFTAIFATISIIEDRREGFLQSVLVAPIPRWSMVLGKILGGSLIAMFQGLLFLVLALTIDVDPGWLGFPALVLQMFVVSVGLTSLGFVIAWQMDSTQGFHAIMSVVLMPMWLLSGAFFPVPSVTPNEAWHQFVLHWMMRLNPLTYCVGGIRHLLYRELPGDAFYTPSLAVCWLVTIAFACIMFAAAWKSAGRRTTGDLL